MIVEEIYRMKRRLIILAGATALCGAGVLGSYINVGAQPQGTSSKAVALSLRDVPAGFTQKKAQSETLAQISKAMSTDSHLMKNAGFTSGYETAFQAPQPKTQAGLKKLKGLIYVDDQISAYRTTAGAHSIYDAERRGALSDARLKKYHMMSFGKIGDESVGYSYSTSFSGVPVTIDALAFRSGRYVAILATAGVSMTLGKQDSTVGGLAKIITSRAASNS